MKTVNLDANPLVKQTVDPSIEFQMSTNDAFADHEEIRINYVDNEGRTYASAIRNVIRIIDAENGQPAWFEAYLGRPSRSVK